MNIRTTLTGVVAALAFTPFVASATLIGDTVEGILSEPDTALTSIDFNFGAFIVGAGDDAAAGATDIFDQTWVFTLDVLDSALTLAIDAPDQPFANIFNSSGVIRIDLLDLDWTDAPGTIVGFALTDYLCMSAACDLAGPGPSISDIGFGPDSVFFELDEIRDGDRYAFGIEARHDMDIPAPAPLALIAIGMIAMSAVRRRRI